MPTSKRRPKGKPADVKIPRDREAVLSDFRKIAGPLRVLRPGKKPKA